MRRLAASLVVLCVASSGSAQIIASAGFNDATGLNSNPTPNSPYNVNNTSIVGQGAGEPGWASSWIIGSNPVTVVNSGQAEGDGAVTLLNTGGMGRILTTPLTGRVSFSLQFKMATSVVIGQGVNGTILQTSTNAFGPEWQASADGHWRVVDGHEDGSGNLLDTGLTWTPGAYQTVRMDIDTVARQWAFVLDGTPYVAPHPLRYRGAPTFLDQPNIMNFTSGPNMPFIDSVIITQLPEPSTLLLAGSAGAGLVLRRRALRRQNFTGRTAILPEAR